MIRPSAVLADHVARDQEARTRYRAVDAQLGTRPVEEACLAQEPQRIAGGNPVITEVLGVAVTGQRRILAGVEHLVHLADKVGIDQIIRIKHEKGIIGLLAFVLKDAVEQPVHRIALADLYLIETLIHGRTRLARHRGGAVRAVVGHDEYIQQVRRIILCFQAFDQVSDHALLIAGGNDRRISVQLCILSDLLTLSEQANCQIHELIGIGRSKKYK